MNCESKICVLENVQTVKCLSYQSVRKKNSSGLFFFSFLLIFFASCCYF